MTEDELLTAVLELAKFAGWRVCHFRPARTAMGWKTAIQGHKGWPDLAYRTVPVLPEVWL